MDLKTFIIQNDVDSCNRDINTELLQKAENEIGLKFGAELKEYILTYGYLSFKSVELYGIVSSLGMESDLIKQTKYIHKYFGKTTDLIAIENQGEGDYYMTDSSDNMFEFDSESNNLEKVHMKLFEYILSRFQQVAID